jgi:hypothetical protein
MFSLEAWRLLLELESPSWNLRGRVLAQLAILPPSAFRTRIGSRFNQVSGSGSRRKKITHKNREKN